jgi:hypothetical protein
VGVENRFPADTTARSSDQIAADVVKWLQGLGLAGGGGGAGGPDGLMRVGGKAGRALSLLG